MGQPTGQVGRRAAFDRARWAVAAVAALVAYAGLVGLWRWWTAWPARLVLAAGGEHCPLAFSPDGATLITQTFARKRLLLWDAATGRQRAAWSIPDRPERLGGIFSADGRTFASPWYDRSAKKPRNIDLIDAGTGRLRATCESPLDGYLGLRFRDGGRSLRLIATDANAAGLRVEVVDFDVTDGQAATTRRLGYDRKTWNGAISPDGGTLALLGMPNGGRKPVVLWDADGDRALPPLPEPAGSAAALVVAFSPDGKFLALGRADGSIEVYDLTTRRLRSSLRDHSSSYLPIALTFAPDGRTLIVNASFRTYGSWSDTIYHYWLGSTRKAWHGNLYEMVVMDAATGRRLRTWTESDWAEFSPDGRTLATSDFDDVIRLRDAPKP